MAGDEDKLAEYRGKRSKAKTPEPVPERADLPQGNDDTFVIQEHHARALHWDLRLERGGVLVSWAMPKGLPPDPKVNHLAVHTEDHPLEYASFAGEIPQGEYGGGSMTIWDHGTYEAEKWRDNEVIFTLRGERSSGKFALFQTNGNQWMIHRMSAPVREDFESMPALIQPMMASPADSLPRDDGTWAYEMKWDGLRAVVYIEGGRARVLTRNDRDVRVSFPELGDLAAGMGIRQLVIDGEIVAISPEGRPDFGLLQQRMHVTSPNQIRSLVKRVPVSYLAFDLLYLDGESLIKKPYDERRAALESLGLSGPSWGVPAAVTTSGADALASSKALNLEGVVAKKRTCPYQPGKRSRDWLKIKNTRSQEVVIGGWEGGKGSRQAKIGALLVGIPQLDGSGLRYIGKVGTGFSDQALRDLAGMLEPLTTSDCPFTESPSDVSRVATWIEPQLVGEVMYTEMTSTGRLRHPSWKGLRPDKSAGDVVEEP